MNSYLFIYFFFTLFAFSPVYSCHPATLAIGAVFCRYFILPYRNLRYSYKTSSQFYRIPGHVEDVGTSLCDNI